MTKRPIYPDTSDQDLTSTYAQWAGFDPQPATLSVAYWLDRVSTLAPLVDADTVETLTRHVLAAAAAGWDVSTDNGSLANALADVSDAAGLARRARLVSMTPGSVDALVAFHAWIKSDQDLPSRPAPAPDPFEGSRHTIRRRRNRKGSYSLVGARGVAQVQGSWLPWYVKTRPVTWGATHRCIIAWWTSQQATRANLRYGAYGANAISATQATRALYPQLDRLAGTDTRGYQERSNLDRARHALGVHWSPDLDETDHHDPRADALNGSPYPKARTSEGATDGRLIAPGPNYPADVFVGHGPARARQATIRQPSHLTTVDAIATTDHQYIGRTAENLAPDQRLALTVGVWQGAITRSGTGRFNMTLSGPGETIKVRSARTVAPLVAALPMV